MIKGYLPILFLFLLFSYNINSQNKELTSLSIPLELKENANAVVRNNVIEIFIEDIDKMKIKKKRVITVLNKVGDREVDTYAHYNDDTKISKLSVKIYDALGKEIKKYSKNKFTDISAVSGGTLYSDARVKYIDYTPTNYPYTVVYESEYTNSSTGFIPKWYPLESFFVSIENSTYKLYNPKNLTLRTKEKNFDGFPIQKIEDSTAEIHYEMENQPAIKYENNTLSFVDLMPSLLVASNNFSLKKVKGFGEDWKSFGKWMNDNLLLGRNKLEPATIAKIKDLVKDAKTDLEKAKIVYKYMQDKTRYISVQVGIGGWEPIQASEVDKIGYGDCKGLTNYTKALLDVVGVKSNYTVVFAKNRRDIDPDFTSMQGNHVILNLPNNGNDVWLECTSQTIPFGFLGDFTDDRNVLVVTPEGGVIKKTPAYKNKTNIQTLKASVQLDAKGKVEAKLNIESKGIQYDNKSFIESKTKKELEKYYKSSIWSYINNLEINSIDLKNNKEDVVFSENLDLSLYNYATVNENEYLFRVNIFNKNSYIPKRNRSRKLPLKVERGYKDVDEFKITIPEGYIINQLPDKKEITSKFGSYIASIEKLNNNTILYKKSLLIKEGIYPKEDYKLYRSFRKKIAKYENLRIALTKE
ncbi:DUF3857 domain-containing protein [Tenacibaculum aquimarinum]|uniref:DUF3857 domain-containing protein n=1 Tax=Tenacibaculum aquimarinum TaxID=2910675 RepID=UPI001F0B19E1|nr:DUF3857 domain-containing protein [Tenacibaculum aquimarinum]MCH3884248.1 DUF3857 domain-containing protein [Tenacibaculum aquimarinum]